MNQRDMLRLHPAFIRENTNAVEQPRTEDRPDLEEPTEGAESGSEVPPDE